MVPNPGLQKALNQTDSGEPVTSYSQLHAIATKRNALTTNVWWSLAVVKCWYHVIRLNTQKFWLDESILGRKCLRIDAFTLSVIKTNYSIFLQMYVTAEEGSVWRLLLPIGLWEDEKRREKNTRKKEYNVDERNRNTNQYWTEKKNKTMYRKGRHKTSRSTI